MITDNLQSDPITVLLQERSKLKLINTANLVSKATRLRGSISCVEDFDFSLGNTILS